MTQIHQQGGASVHARGRIPSTNLALLIKLLVQAFPEVKSQQKNVFSLPVFVMQPSMGRLGINTYGIIRRLTSTKEFYEKFKQADTSGFFLDITYPSKGFTAKMGGKIFNDDIGGVSEEVNKLKRLIAEQLDLLKITANNTLVIDPNAALNKLAVKTGLKNFLKEIPANIIPIEFAKAGNSASAGDKDVAKVFSAEEEIQAEDWLERMSSSMAEAQALRDDEFDDIQRDRLIETLRQDFDKSDSQVTRFLNFLEDQALARVRLVVSFTIMQGLATQAKSKNDLNSSKFLNYVLRVINLFKLYGASESSLSWHFNLSRDYGVAADFSASTELVKATFYDCLPVWAEVNTQLFESRKVDSISRGVAIAREVSYRFRVNGKDPQKENNQAFDSRIEHLSEVLLADAKNVDKWAPRTIVQLTFLWLVLNPNIAIENMQTEAEALAVRLNTESKACIRKLLSDLSSWKENVKNLAKTLVSLLKNKSGNVISSTQRAINDLYLVVQQEVVDWDAIERSRGKVRDPLVKPNEGQTEQVEWLKHIKVAKTPNDVINPLFSIRVRTTLRERRLIRCKEEVSKIRTVRVIPDELLNIIWRPIHVDESEGKYKTEIRHEIEDHWLIKNSVHIWYDPDQLALKKYDQSKEEDHHQYRAAIVSAMSILVYCVLQVLIERISKEIQKPIPTIMLRFQSKGKEATTAEGDTSIYAAAHAIESALMRDVPVRMQGMVLPENDSYKKLGTVFALASAFPLVLGLTSKPIVAKIAIIVYTTRPCDDHPSIKDANGFIFLAKTYLAETVETHFPGYRLNFERMQSYVVDNTNAFKNHQLIIEEISRLHSLGYEHIILLSSHHGNRRINRSAQRHSPHTQTQFLDQVAINFHNVSIYMLRRDVVPATRIYNRFFNESAFEATQLANHNEFAITQGDGVVKQLIPIYTFSTLTIVGKKSGEDDSSRPQSGFCTYFLDTDYQVRNIEWRERVRSNIMSNAGIRNCLLTTLRGLHFLEAEKRPNKNTFIPVLNPFEWVQPKAIGAAGEIEVPPPGKRHGGILLSLPALLSHVTNALHREKS